ncbi:MAG: hypothetical protein ACTSXX_04200 [Candidatus Baldrarchaeia archaeon]
MKTWIFSSKDLENIRTASQRLIWGFWRKEASDKHRTNWRNFLRLYNSIKPGDIAFFQIAKTGEIHALGVIAEKFYDDQTPIWKEEISRRTVLFPWRVSFSFMLFSEKPLTKMFIKIENYVDGYGIGEIPPNDAKTLLNEIAKKIDKNAIISAKLGE